MNDDSIVTFRLHYGGVLVRGDLTEYRDSDYINIETERNRVCMWSFTMELRNPGFKDSDVNGVYYKQPLKTVKDGLRLIHDESSLYDTFSCANRYGLIELYVEHSDEWLRTSNKLVDMVNINFISGSRSESTSCNEGRPDQNIQPINNDKNERNEDDEASSEDQGDGDEDCEAALDSIIETFDQNQDTGMDVGINEVRKHYTILRKTRKIPGVKNPQKFSHQNDEVEDNFPNNEDNYLDNSDVDSLHEETLEDGTIEMRRTPVRFSRYNENCRTVNVSIGLSFTDHKQFKKALLKYAVQEKRDYEFIKNARCRVTVKCKDEHCKWLVFAADEVHHGKKYFLIKTLNESHTCSKLFKISHLTSSWIAEEWETMIYAHPGIKSTYIQDTIKAQLELEVTKNQCKRAKAMLMKRLERDVLHEYKRLNDYARALVEANPGTSIHIEVQNIGNEIPAYFKRMYVCLDAVRKGFLDGCRKYLGIDGCFLKGVVKGMLLTAVGKDPNNQMLDLILK